MCKISGVFICLNLIGIVVVTVYLLQNLADQTNMQYSIDDARSQGSDSRYYTCQLLCPSFPYAIGNICCPSLDSHICFYKYNCLSDYIRRKEDQLSGLIDKQFQYLIIDGILGFVLICQICRICRKRNSGPSQQDITNQSALRALLFSEREQTAHRGDRSLLTQSFIAQDKTQNCAICLEPFEEQRVVGLNCTHKYHRGCIQAWINRGDASCPVCRAPQ